MKISEIIMATNNQNKLKEAREILAPLGITVVSLAEAGISVNPEENGTTFAENAIIKACAVYDLVKRPVMADDSGLCVETLGDAPGVYSARYAPKGQECQKLLQEMQNIPDSDRTARFETAICFIDESNQQYIAYGRCNGKIAFAEKGKNGFGYDPVFLYGDRTLAELSAEEKNKISHRGYALRNLYEFLKERDT